MCDLLWSVPSPVAGRKGGGPDSQTLPGHVCRTPQEPQESSCNGLRGEKKKKKRVFCFYLGNHSCMQHVFRTKKQVGVCHTYIPSSSFRQNTHAWHVWTRNQYICQHSVNCKKVNKHSSSLIIQVPNAPISNTSGHHGPNCDSGPVIRVNV